MGDNPAVGEKRGSFQARKYTTQTDKAIDYDKARGKETHTNTHIESTRHILCCGFLIILGLQIEELSLSRFKCCKRTKMVLKKMKKHFL